MRTAVFLLAWIAAVSAPAREAAPHARVFPSSTGLILIASAQEGMAIAGDGASSNADGTISQEQKLFPVGKTGAVAVAGTVSIQDPVNRPVREEVNVARLTAAWLNTHPDASFEVASKEINAVVSQATTKFFSARDPGRAAGRYKFALIFAGFVDGKPVVRATRYYMPPSAHKAMRAEPLHEDAPAGQIWVFGQSKVAQALLAGASPSLAKFGSEGSIKKLRSSPRADLTLQDYVNAFDTVLRATESPQGKKMIVVKLAVAPPNKFAVISKDGFMWSEAEGRH